VSSLAVRTAIKTFISSTLPGEHLIDLTSQTEELRDLIQREGLADDAPWLGIEFFGDDEVPVTVPATNGKGKFRETGTIQIHVVAAARLGAGDGLLTRGEALRDLLRGQRIGDVLIETVTPMNFNPGSTLDMGAGYMSGTTTAAYEFDRDIV
jgi:hypothetical protein